MKISDEGSLFNQERAQKLTATKTLYWEGGGLDCELCGFNPFQVTFRQFNEWTFYLNVRDGCRQGLYTEKPEEALNELYELYCSVYSEDDEMRLKEIRDAVWEMW